MANRPGRLGHGYQIRVEHVGEACAEYGQLWGIEDELPEEWDEFQQEHIGDPTIHSAQIYRSSETRKWMDKRTISGEFVNRDISIPFWRRNG